MFLEGEGDADQTLGEGGDSHCSTPRLQTDMVTVDRVHADMVDRVHGDMGDGDSCCSGDLTLYEDVTSQRNMSQASTRSRNNSTSSTKCHEVEIAIGDRSSSSYDPVGTPEDFGPNFGIIPLQKEEQQDFKSKRRDSVLSNIFINLSSILDV